MKSSINFIIISLLSLLAISIDTRSTTKRSSTLMTGTSTKRSSTLMTGTKTITCDSISIINDISSTCTSCPPSTATTDDSGTTTATSTSTSTSTSGLISGQATYYTEWSTSLGSCGLSVSESPVSTGSIVALPQMYMNANCNQCVQVNYNGKSIIVTATDTCPGCGDTGIDLSQDGFTELAGSTDAGRIDVTWQIVPCA